MNLKAFINIVGLIVIVVAIYNHINYEYEPHAFVLIQQHLYTTILIIFTSLVVMGFGIFGIKK